MKTATQQEYEERILRVLVHIQAHLDCALELEELATIANFSPFHFHRVFRGMVGEPVMEHIRRLRLERAAYHLKCSDRPVTQIAFDAGFEAHEAFTRAFKTMFAVPPSEFREQHRPVPVPSSPSGVHFDPDGRLDGFHPVPYEGAKMDVRIEELKPLRVVFMRHVGPYNQVGATWGRLCQWAGMRGLFGANSQCFGVCYDDPEITPPDKIRYDACLTVNRPVQAEGDVGVQEIAGGRYAVVTHHGPYEKLAETYAAVMGQWLPAHSHELMSGPSLEFYRNDPNKTPPADLLTDVYVPLRR
jgi:AraC family transcriptional regulator